MKVILNERVKNLGYTGDIVNVARGYAINFLLPQKKAEIANEKKRKALSEQKKRLTKKISEERKKIEEKASSLKDKMFSVKKKSSEGGKLFGSVTLRDIIKVLHEGGFEVDKKSIKLLSPIKRVGTFDIKINFLTDVKTQFKLEVIPIIEKKPEVLKKKKVVKESQEEDEQQDALSPKKIKDIEDEEVSKNSHEEGKEKQ